MNDSHLSNMKTVTSFGPSDGTTTAPATVFGSNNDTNPGGPWTIPPHNFNDPKRLPESAVDQSSGPADSGFANKLSADLFKDGEQFLNVLKSDFDKIANSDFAKNLYGDLQLFGK